MPRYVRWGSSGWRGWRDATARIDPLACLRAAESEAGRASRHARTVCFTTAEGVLFVKSYPAPGGWRATRAFRMARALAARGFGAPEVLLAAYGAERGLSRPARHRLGKWVVRKTIARRCVIDHIPPGTAARVGFRELMRSGGPFDPACGPS